MKQSRKGMLMAALICGTIVPVLFGGTSVYAEEKKTDADESLSSFALEEMVVTAARYEKKDVDIAASTDVITRERLDETGATNAFEALRFSTGLTVDGKAPGGASYGSMTSKIAIRGIEKGTLVMMNGTPINFRGLYSLDSIPADIIERIEIVRGGGSVLYGSEASGGVINIITKKDAKHSSVRVGFGKQSRQNHSIDIHAGKLGVNYTYDKWGHVGYISDSKAVNAAPGAQNMSQDFLKSELHNGTITYKFSDNVDAIVRHSVRNSYTNYTFNDSAFNKLLAGVNHEPRYWRDYETKSTFAQVNFKDDYGFKGNVYYNKNVLNTDGKDYYTVKTSKGVVTKVTPNNPITFTNTTEKNLTAGVDLQKLWQTGKNNYLLGLSVAREFYKDDDVKYNRTVSSIYGSWDTGIGSKNLFTLSARGTKVSGAESGKNYSNFSGQMQYTHKLDDNQSVYASVGQSFKLPTLKEMYASGNGMVLGDENLKPEKGMHYEIGYKYVTKSHEWKVALFATRLKDSITYSKISGNLWQTKNEEFKNYGIELSNITNLNNGFTFNYGITWQNPKVKEGMSQAADDGEWTRKYGKFLLNTGVTYKKDKWTANLTASYLADRVMNGTNDVVKTSPYLLTSLNIKYAPEKNQEIALSMDNILDRNDNISHTSSNYYGTPFTYLLSYTYKF